MKTKVITSIRQDGKVEGHTNQMSRINATRTVLLAMLFFAVPILGLRQPQDSPDFLIRITESKAELSPTGVTVNDCILVQPNGRFHLERRRQQLPEGRAKLTIYESSLTKAQLQQLREIVEQQSIEELPEFSPPTPPLGVSDFRTLVAELNRETVVKHIGFFSWRGDSRPGAPPESTPADMKKAWEDSEKALQPLADWFHGLEGRKMPPSKASSNLCGIKFDDRESQ